MKLTKDWLTHGLIDFEYKKYVLLAYLKDVNQHFQTRRLYPFLSDLVFHYNNLLSIKKNKKLIYENFPKEISKADFEKLKLTYRKMIEDDDIMEELEQIIEFSLPQLKNTLDAGACIYEEIEDETDIQPVGISPLYSDEGYMFLANDISPTTRIYRFQITLFEKNDDKYKAINTKFLGSEDYTIANSFEQMKMRLVRSYQDLPNPATYLVKTQKRYPVDETILPVAKRLLVKHISTAA